MKPRSLTCLLLVISFASNAQTAIPDTWVTNGTVSSITRGGGKIFLGGSFNWVGPSYGSGEAVFNSTLVHDKSYPAVGQRLRDAVSDDAGGWYIAKLNTIVHLKSDKTIDELAVDVNGILSTIEKVGEVLYFGGSFSQVNGVARGSGAAFDLTAGTITSWDANSNGNIEVIVGSGGVIYAGGNFTNIGGQARAKIAALDASTGLATSWNASVASTGGFVSAIIVDAGVIYFGGSFTNVGGGAPARTNLAAVSTTTGALLTFNPRPNSFIYNLLLDGTTLYMSGNFSQVGATPKDRFAVMDVTSGAFTSFAITVSDFTDVTSLAVDGQKLFLGGSFTEINGEDRPRLAAVNKTTGVLEPMDAGKVSDVPYRLVVSSGKILAIADDYFIGTAGKTTSTSIVALDEDTGESVNWTADIPAPSGGDGYLERVDLHYQNNRVYFLQRIYHSMDGYEESALAWVDATDGSLIAGSEVVVDNLIEAWAFSEDALYLEGQFTEVNGESRSGFAAIDLATGDVLPWTISFVPEQGQISSMAVHNNVLYVAGEFDFSEGGERRNLAAWNATTGALTDWNPEYFSDFNTPIIGAVTDSHVYIIGNGIYPVDAVTGDAGSGWLALFNEVQVASMAIRDSEIFVGGYFSSGGQTATLARLDLTTGEVTGTQPVLDDTYAAEGSGVAVVAASDTKLFVGGGFSFDVNGIRRANYAEYLLSSPVENSPPQIATTTATVVAKGIITIDLQPLISDPDNNLDLSTLALVSESSEQGASASLDELILTLNYEGVTFIGDDHITVRICDLLGECVEQELTIEVIADSEIPGDIIVYNAVSPNGDKKNDFFMLEYIDSFADNKVTIFNRWGDLVFDVSGYNNTDRVFTGTNKNGNELPTGIYYYKIEYDGGKKDKSGYLSLKR